MCMVCKSIHGKTPKEALEMLDELDLPSGQGQETRVKRLARNHPQGHYPHRKNIESLLQRLLKNGAETVDLMSESKNR